MFPGSSPIALRDSPSSGAMPRATRDIMGGMRSGLSRRDVGPTTSAPPARPRLAPDEFAARYTEASHTLWCIAASVLGRRTGVADVLQEAALIALSKIDDFDPDTNFVAWMGRIVRNVASNHRRKHRRHAHSGHDPDHLQADNPGPQMTLSGRGDVPVDQEHFDDRLLNALNTLDETPRACLLLRTIRGMPYKEISLALGIPEGTAMSHVHRSRQALRLALSARPGAARSAEL